MDIHHVLQGGSMELIFEQYNIVLIIFSIVIAIVASYSALALYLRGLYAPGLLRESWLISGALALGIGIWCMHFTGVIAYKPISQLHLDLVYVCFSLFIAIIGLYFLLKISSPLSSLLFSISIGFMH